MFVGRSRGRRPCGLCALRCEDGEMEDLLVQCHNSNIFSHIMIDGNGKVHVR